ncbi:MAG: hypothetical protein QM770_04225 [Tepidisphaeraceae bacterium]
MTTANRLGWLLLCAVASVGCDTPQPAPPRAPVPQVGEGPRVETYGRRPLPPQDPANFMPPPAFDDQPLVTQAPPEQNAYLAAYSDVGRPRIVVFVNRSVEGKIIPVDERRALYGVDYTRRATGAVDVDRSSSAGVYAPGVDASGRTSDRFKTDGPAQLDENVEVYLAAGQYDEAQAKRIDYDAIENVITDWMGAGGRVTLVSPDMARTRLSDQEVKELQEGRPQVLREVAEKLDADVLIQVQAKPTKQTADGLQIRVLCEAINTKGGESIARAFVDVPPPLEKTQINKYTRFLARKLMYELAGSWSSMPPRGPEPTTRPR